MSIRDWFRKKKKKKLHSITLDGEPQAINNILGGGTGFTGEKFAHALNRKLFNSKDIDHDTIRHLSEEYYNSNSIAHGIIDTKTISIINRGLTLEAKPLGNILNRSIPEDWSKIVEQRFDLWAKHKGVDYNFNQNFYQIQIELFKQLLLKGQYLAIFRFIPNPRRGRIGRLNIQTIDIDQLFTPMEERHKKNKMGEDIINGLHLDDTGTIVGIYLRKKNILNPFNPLDYVYIPRWGARTGRLNFVLGIRKQYPGDVNGMPDLTPILHDIAKVEDYRISEIQAALVNSTIALIQNSNGDLPNPNMFASGVGKRTDTAIDADDNVVTKPNYDLLAPGIHIYASQPGQKLESFDTKRPNASFKEFVETSVLHLTSSINLPQEILYKKFANNYSASRATLLEYWRYVLYERANFSGDFCQVVSELWLSDEINLGYIKADGWNSGNISERVRNRKAWANAEWQGSAKGSVDLVKEATAASIAEDRGWTTAEANAREIFGKNFDANMERRGKEKPLQQNSKVE